MATFVLVHGGQHGGWCWDQLRPYLDGDGHQVVAPDLPIEDPDNGAVAYGRAAAGSIGGWQDPVVLVGHSMGGLTLPVMAEMVPARLMIFLAPFIPVPGTSYEQYLGDHPEACRYPTESNVVDSSGRHSVPWEVAKQYFYSDCSHDVARQSWLRLRPQAMKVMVETCPTTSWPEVPSVFIAAQDDPVIPLSWAKKATRQRFGAPVVEIPGGHSPFLSRPSQLAGLITEIVRARGIL